MLLIRLLKNAKEKVTLLWIIITNIIIEVAHRKKGNVRQNILRRECFFICVMFLYFANVVCHALLISFSMPRRDMARHMEKRDEIGEKDGGRGRD